MTQTQYPVLVYGTLRPGQHNWEYFLNGNTVLVETVVFPGAKLLAGKGFPFAVFSEGDSIVADLVYIAPDQYDKVLTRLDFLEGFIGEGEDNFYDRVLVNFTVGGVPRQAYMYVVAQSSLSYTEGLPKIEDGDWVRHHTDLMLAGQ